VLYGSSEERREPLERVVERLQTEDAKRRYRELAHYMDERYSAGEPISEEVRAEYRALVSKLQG